MSFSQQQKDDAACLFSVLADPHGAGKFVSLEARQE